MSRSFRKFPIVRYEKEDYHLLNRLLRRKNKNIDYDLGQNSYYRKVIPKWNTWTNSSSLYNFTKSHEEFGDSYEEAVNKYYKFYIRK